MKDYDGGSQGILAPRASAGRKSDKLNTLADFMDKLDPNSSILENTTKHPF
jgi:hypothetical protein